MSTNNWTIGTILAKTITYLKEKQLPSPRLEADLLLASILDLPRVKLYADWDRPLEEPEVVRFRELLLKRVQGWPLAYLTGKKSFLSWDFIVSPAVLVPRPETELLVETVFELVKDRQHVSGVDLGTGSGVIAVSLAKLLPNSQWEAVDISAAALEVAGQNAALLGVAERVSFQEGDLFAPFALDRKFDLIVSNPPYVPGPLIPMLQAEVKREPQIALDGGVDGLDLYRRLFPEALKFLAEDGIIAVEHGDEQRRDLEELAAALNLHTQSITDLAGRDRVLICRRRPD